MSYLVLSQKLPPKEYRDEVGKVYNYPKRYWNRIETGDRFIYHQPHSGPRAGKVYFGCGIIGSIRQDPQDAKRRIAELLNYMEFIRPVPVSRDKKFIEPAIRSSIEMVGNAVRKIDADTATLILRLSETDPPWR